ncbi:MAG: hypothetical protein WDW36_004592 [Sanguina aurantia]
MGLPDLDRILEGGLPLGSLLLVIEDPHSHQHLNLIKYFLAEGVACGQRVGWLTPNQSLPAGGLASLLPAEITASQDTEASSSSSSSKAVAAAEPPELKIAWQYRKYIAEGKQRQDEGGGASQGSAAGRARVAQKSSFTRAGSASAAGVARQWCHTFDLSAAMGEAALARSGLVSTQCKDDCTASACDAPPPCQRPRRAAATDGADGPLPGGSFTTDHFPPPAHLPSPAQPPASLPTPAAPSTATPASLPTPAAPSTATPDSTIPCPATPSTATPDSTIPCPATPSTATPDSTIPCPATPSQASSHPPAPTPAPAPSTQATTHAQRNRSSPPVSSNPTAVPPVEVSVHSGSGSGSGAPGSGSPMPGASLPHGGVGRLVLQSVGSPAWEGRCGGDGEGRGGGEEGGAASELLRAVFSLRQLVQQSRCCVMVTCPAGVLPRSVQLRLQHLAHTAIVLQPLTDDSPIFKLLPESTSAVALLSVAKLCSTGMVGPRLVDDVLHVVRHRRKKLVITHIQVDPDAEARLQQEAATAAANAFGPGGGLGQAKGAAALVCGSGPGRPGGGLDF